MTNEHFYMLFGSVVTLLGFILARSSQVGQGQTTIRLFGGEFSLAAAGGVVVMLLGIIAFSLPMLWGDGRNPPGHTDSTPTSEATPVANTPTDRPSEPAATASPAPTEASATPLQLTSARPDSTDVTRDGGGWAKNAPTYNYWILTYSMSYDASLTDADCANKIIREYGKESQPIDYALDGVLMFTKDNSLINVWCHSGEATRSVFGLLGDDLNKIGDRVDDILKKALPPAAKPVS